MRVCKIDQDIRLGVFWDVYGDIRHGLNGGRTRREVSAPSVAVVPAHAHSEDRQVWLMGLPENAWFVLEAMGLDDLFVRVSSPEGPPN